MAKISIPIFFFFFFKDLQSMKRNYFLTKQQRLHKSLRCEIFEVSSGNVFYETLTLFFYFLFFIYSPLTKYPTHINYKAQVLFFI